MPTWCQLVQQAAGAVFACKVYSEGLHYITRLADDRAALILVHADALDDWRFWIVTPKTSPATRRIPIVVVSAQAETRRAALKNGADFALTADELAAQLARLLAVHARVPQPEKVEEMDSQCAEALPPAALEGVRRFNAGEYYKQHDLFEALWVEEAGAVRDLYRAILQVGVAYYQIERGNARGAHKMLLRSVQWLTLLPDVCRGVDIRQLREDSYRVRAELERISDVADFDKTLLKPLRLVNASHEVK